MQNPVIDNIGTKCWFNMERELHRNDGPAVIRSDGRLFWYLENCLYKDNQSFQQDANLSDEQMAAIVVKYGNVS